MLVEAWLARAAAARPARTALHTPAGSWTYAELLAAAQLGARELAGRGAGPGARVAIAVPGRLAFAQALHACLLMGAIAVPVDVRAPERERAQLAAGAEVVLEEPLPVPEQGEDPGGAIAALAETAWTHELGETAAVIHTSGTSGSPRPVELTYGNFLWSALGSAVALGLDAEERWLCALPVCHVGGLSILVRSAIYATTALVHERFDVERVRDALLREDVTLVSLVATTLARLLDGGLTAPPRLRCALTGGGPVPAALLARAREAGVPVSLTYGLTEACSQVTTTPLATLGRGRTQPGPPLFCTRVAIAPGARVGEGEMAGTGADAPPGTGEILVRGPTVASGAAAADGWLHTGDVGRLDEQGCLHVTGRLGEVIISGGENVAPSEVESVLESHPEVLEAAVVGRADEQWGEAVTAIVVARPGFSPDAEVLREHCARVLAPYKVPRQILLREAPLPRTRSGKLQRTTL